jgi:AcrR family transcriptional regulator
MRKPSAAKRENIIKAAGNLFMQKGVDATSMDEIAASAEVSKQTLYSHFGSKEGLFAEAIRDKCLLNNLSEGFFDQPLPPVTLLTGFARQFLGMMMTEEVEQMQRTCIAQALQHPDVSQLFYDTGPNLLMKALQRYFERMNASGEMSVPDARAAAWQFLHLVRGDITFRQLLGVPQELNQQEMEDYLQNTVAMFLRAYAPLSS